MAHQLAQGLSLPWGGDQINIQGQLSIPGYGGDTVTLGDIISYATQYILLFAGIGLLLMLLSGGFTFLTSAGDTKKLEQGKARLTNALLGFLIIFAAYWLVQAAGIIFNFTPAQTIFR